MTPLEAELVARIRAEGPMPVAEYMGLCLGHPRHGYYVTRDPLGVAGDFTTAPEISQMFGEMAGLWLAAVWLAAGRPDPVRLVELGPGRGTLMADILNAARATGLADAADVWLVETSPVLRAAQAERVAQASWAADLAAVPEGPLLLVANEFFDALPVRQFLRGPRGWCERLVGLADGRLGFGLSEPLPGPPSGPPSGAHAADWREVCPAAAAVSAEAARRISAAGGAALVFDYGYTAADRPPGPTLQALRQHARADPLATPGAADLTALVDFDALAAALAPLRVRVAGQGVFLAALGIGQRAAALARAAPERADALADALERLTDPALMGTLFKVAAAVPAAAPPPPGFAEAP